MEAIVVPIDKIEPNPWNPNVQSDEIYAKEIASIEKFGFVDPITVREVGFDRFQIIDGEHRWKAGREHSEECRPADGVHVGYVALPCWNLGLIEDADAREMTVVLNETRGVANEDRLRSLLEDLIKRRGSEDPVREIMPFSRERFNEIMGRMEVDWQKLEERREALAAQGRWKELVFRVPAEAADTINNAIDRVKEEEGFEDRWKALEMICADRMA